MAKPEEPSDRKEELLDQMIETANMLHAKSAREAADMVAGRELTDSEWSEVAPLWEARWY
jgi:hypothetical protein